MYQLSRISITIFRSCGHLGASPPTPLPAINIPDDVIEQINLDNLHLLPLQKANISSSTSLLTKLRKEIVLSARTCLTIQQAKRYAMLPKNPSSFKGWLQELSTQTFMAATWCRMLPTVSMQWRRSTMLLSRCNYMKGTNFRCFTESSLRVTSSTIRSLLKPGDSRILTAWRWVLQPIRTWVMSLL